MIKVDEVSDGVFQVAIDDDELRTVDYIGRKIHVSRSCVVRGHLVIMLWVGSEDSILERIEDGLEGKNEGLGRG